MASAELAPATYDLVWTGLVAVLALGAIAVVLTAVVLLIRSLRGGSSDGGGGSAADGGAPGASAGSSTSGSVDERLAEVDALAARGAITDAERQAARDRILGTL
ncbi:hypothetical protein GCM10025865_17830 [Paraoerskovia sediminicola]|uniref:SHOCT domain-containing protein n=1 Tax=Paraoerskovia sediminicola TaxID=1138587 RepID=A0ABN6XC88_9CELL|nr:hypothetical protein GCM10025865_17830 [Paraoerskovia sediminicola]